MTLRGKDNTITVLPTAGIRVVARDKWMARIKRDPSVTVRWFGTTAEIRAIDEQEMAAWRRRHG
jgi:hypothetical protein